MNAALILEQTRSTKKKKMKLPVPPHSAVAVNEKINKAKWKEKTFVQHEQTFPFFTIISKDWSKLLMLQVLKGTFQSALFIGTDGISTNLLVVGSTNYTKDELIALLLTASSELHVEVNSKNISTSFLEDILRDWKKKYSINAVSGMCITKTGIYRCGEWDAANLILEEVALN